MNKLARWGTFALMMANADVAAANCPTKVIIDPVDNCSTCHQMNRRGLDSPSALESVRIGQAVINQLGNSRYRFYHDHAESCRGMADVIYIVPRYGGEAEAAVISDAHGEPGKTLIRTQSVNGLVQELQYYLIKQGISVPSAPEVSFPPTSDHYQNAVNEANRLR